MISLGASSESLMINAETDFGPRVSLELNSLFPNSLSHVSDRTLLYDFWGGGTSGSHPRAGGSHIARRECGEIQPWALTDARSMSSSERLKFVHLPHGLVGAQHDT